MKTTITADANGTFSIVEFPADIGKQCNLEVQYEWGAAALQIK